MTTLHVYLMGLVALVPSNDGKSITILMQEARREPLYVHYPVLIYDKKNLVTVVGDEGKEIKEVLHLRDEPPGFFLNGVDIEFDAKMSGDFEFLKGWHKPSWIHPWIGTVPGSLDEAKDSFWIPEMKRVVPGSEVVRNLYLGNDVSACDVAARLSLGHGKVSTVNLTSYQTIIHSLTFKKMGGLPVLRGTKEALADIAMIEITLDDPKVEIYTREFRGARQKRLSLIPKDGVIDILIGNLTRLVKPTSEPAMHFALYQKLSENPQENVPVPHMGMWRSVSEGTVGGQLPEVIRSVSGDPTDAKGRILYRYNSGESGTDRPMCTLIIMKTP